MLASQFLIRYCPICGSDQKIKEVHSQNVAENMSFDDLRPFWSGLFKEKIFFSYHRCENCRLLYAPQFYTDKQLNLLYSEMAPNMDLVPSEALKATQHSYYETAAKRPVVRGDYLEIGPDVGYIVRDVAQSGNYDHFWLFEPNRAVHDELGQATGGAPHTILTDMNSLSMVPDQSIGLAAMIQVLDHLLDPLGMLRQVCAKLKTGGTLMIVTHNEASLLRSVMRSNWPPFCLQHPQIYNPRSMKAILDRAGFSNITVSRSKNYFPIAFMIRQAAWAVGVDLNEASLPSLLLGLKLGNMITLAWV